MTEQWSPKKIVIASLAVAIFSSALTGGIVVWLLSGQTSPAPVYSPNSPITPPTPGMSPTSSDHVPPEDPVQAGNWHYDHQQWTEAIAAYETALKSGTDNPDVRTDLGNCYRFSKNPKMALAQYEIAQKQNPDHEHSLFNQISLYADDLKNPRKANELAKIFIERFPNRPTTKTARKYLNQ